MGSRDPRNEPVRVPGMQGGSATDGDSESSLVAPELGLVGDKVKQIYWFWINIDGNPYFECGDCGAITTNTVRHMGWHNEQRHERKNQQ